MNCLVVALASVALVTGCEQPRTELMIGIATDIRAPNLIDGAELLVTRARDGFIEQQVSWVITGVPNQPVNLPGSYGIYSDGEEIKLDIVLTGLKGATPVVTRRAVLNLVEGKTLFFRMGLTAGCIDKDDCLATQSCTEGVCRDVEINADQLPDFKPELITELSCASGTNYIDTATGVSLPLTEGAEECPVGLCLEGTCLKPPPEQTGTRTVTGYQFTTYIQPTKTTNVPTDLTTLMPRALVPNTDGNFTIIPGRGATDGSFVIDEVPHGLYYLQVGTNYFVTRANSFDLTSARLGRPDAMAPVATSTITLGTVTGLDTWADGDELEAFAVDADTWWFALQDINPITVGTTTLSNYSFTAQQANGSYRGNLIRNDPTALIQLRGKQTASGDFYRTATNFCPLPLFTQTDGGTSTVNGAFVPVPQTAMFTADFRTSQWDAALGYNGTNLTALHPQAVEFASSGGFSISLLGNAGGPLHGEVGATADYLFAPVPHGPDRVFANMSYGIPTLPGLWASVLDIRSGGFVRVQLPSTTAAAGISVGISQNSLLAASSGPITPAMGPVSAPTIDGLDLFRPQSQQVKTSPTLTWQPPTIGKPSQYQVEVIRLTAMGTSTLRATVATLFTTEPTLVIPPGVLMVGQSYVVRIIAETTPNTDAPFRRKFPAATSTIASSIFVPTVETGTPVDPPMVDAAVPKPVDAPGGGQMVDAAIDGP
ncbi:MAG: hypothetical protein H0T89_15125 [Deltaproteobacteria bacterium]|nr:hypothetical protein [Deltaproteobacteria bacterium]MDQ3295134.1 hypothetical protein [Myxococcota bacterium]